MENNQNDIAIISIIVSGVIALTSVIFPIILNLLSEKAKWKRDQINHERNVIDEVSINLLNRIAMFRSGNVTAATKDNLEKATSDIISAFYNWERVVWVKLSIVEQSEIKQLRNDFETGNYQTFYEKAPVLADKILNYADIVSKRIK